MQLLKLLIFAALQNHLHCSTLFYIALHRPTLFYIVLHCTTAPSPSPTAPQVSLKCFTAASVVTPLFTFYVCYTLYIVPPVDFHTRTKLGWKTFSTLRPGIGALGTLSIPTLIWSSTAPINARTLYHIAAKP